MSKLNNVKNVIEIAYFVKIRLFIVLSALVGIFCFLIMFVLFVLKINIWTLNKVAKDAINNALNVQDHWSLNAYNVPSRIFLAKFPKNALNNNKLITNKKLKIIIYVKKKK